MKNNDYQTSLRLDMIINVMKNILKDFNYQASLRPNMIIKVMKKIIIKRMIIKRIRDLT